jgi:hypothetical protein
MRLLLMLPGHGTFRNLSRDSPYHDRTFARHFATAVAFVALNTAAIMRRVPPDHAQALVREASFVPKRGQPTDGLAHCWNGTQSRTEKGLEGSALGWLEVTDTCASVLRVEQTPPPGPAADPEATRIASYLEQVPRGVQPQALSPFRSVVTEGYSSKQKCLAGIRAVALHQLGTWRREAHLRFLDDGPPPSGPGRPQPYDGTVHWSALSRFERMASSAEGLVLYTQVVNHVQCKRNGRVVLVVETCPHRSARLLSTDIDLAAARL